MSGLFLFKITLPCVLLKCSIFLIVFYICLFVHTLKLSYLFEDLEFGKCWLNLIIKSYFFNTDVDLDVVFLVPTFIT